MEVGRFCLVNGMVVRTNFYPPGNVLPVSIISDVGFPLFLQLTDLFHQFYAVDNPFTIRRPRDLLHSETVKLTITESVDVGWCNLSQSVKACVEAGPQHLLGKEVF